MTQDALLGIQADIEKKQTDRKRYEEDKARDFQQLQINLTNRLRTEMVTIIESLSKERGYDLVLDLGTSGIVTFSPAIDITEEVVKRYDQTKTAAPPVKK
jgi:Skp family chaperone for outer membrane proteins